MSKRAKSKNATVRKEVQGDAPKCRRLFPFVSLARLLSLKVALFPTPILHLAVTSTKGASGIASPPLEVNDTLKPSHRWTNGPLPLKTIEANG